MDICIDHPDGSTATVEVQEEWTVAQLYAAAEEAFVGRAHFVLSTHRDGVEVTLDNSSELLLGTGLSEGDVVRLRHAVGTVLTPAEYDTGCEQILTILLTSDNATLLTAGQHGGIQVWDTSSAHRVATLQGSCNVVCGSLAFGPSERYVFSSGSGVRLWDLHTFCEAGSLFAGTARALAVHNGERSVVYSGMDDGAIGVWEVSLEGGLIKHDAYELVGHENEVNCIVTAGEGARLFSCCNDGRIRRWNAADRVCEKTKFAHFSSVIAICLSADESKVYSTGFDQYIKIWHADSFQNIGRIFDTSMAFGVVVSDNTIYTTNGEGDVRKWDDTTHACTGTIRGRGQGWERPLALTTAKDVLFYTSGAQVCVVPVTSASFEPTDTPRRWFSCVLS